MARGSGDKTICKGPRDRYHDSMNNPIFLQDETETVRMAQRLANVARAGDVVALHGTLGMGKTAFARAFIRARAGNDALTVPSPTFTLVQIYELPNGAVWHVDAYRLASADEALELGLDEAFATAITLIEWPENIAELIPESALHLYLTDGPAPESRQFRLVASAAWRARTDDLGDVCGA